MRYRILFIAILVLLPAFFVSAQKCCVVINEIQLHPTTYDGRSGTSSDLETGEVIELYNKCDQAIDISCWKLVMWSGSFGGEIVRIPSGTTLRPGKVYTIGGNGSIGIVDNFSTDADWPGINLDLNWHQDQVTSDPDCGAGDKASAPASCSWDGKKVETLESSEGDPSHFWGVLINNGEDILLYNDIDTLIDGITYDGGAGTNASADFPPGSYNYPALGGCNSGSLQIPASSTLPDLGDPVNNCCTFNPGGFQRQCNGTYNRAAYDTTDNCGFGNCDAASQLNIDTSLNCSLTDCYLPLYQLTFTVNPISPGKAKLHWETIPQSNIEYFLLQRKKARQSYQTIQTIEVSSSSSSSYAVIDTPPSPGRYYYRLKLIYPKKSNTFSPIRSIQLTPAAITIFPLPAYHTLHIQYTPHLGSSAQLLLVNPQGRTIKQHTLPAADNTNTFKLNVAAVEPGIYHLIIAGESIYKTRKVIIN